MISTIVCGGTAQERHDYIQAIDPNSPTTIHIMPEPTSIGISVIKDLVMTLSISASLPRLVWVEEAQTLTPDASGALLKVLEEPPHNTTLYLTCPSSQGLLPTIRSRCQITTLKSNSVQQSTSNLKLLKDYFSLPLGERLARASALPSDRAELLAFLATVATELDELLRRPQSSSQLKLLSQLSRLTLETHSALDNNANPALAVGHYLLHLPKTK